MKSHIIIASIGIMMAIILFELILLHQGQNDYPGALISLVTMATAVMLASTHRGKRD